MTTSGSAFKIAKLFLEFKNSNKALTKENLKARRKLRGELYKSAILYKNYSESDKKARREYWHKQTYYLYQLLKKHCADPKNFDFKKELKEYLSDDANLKKLMGFIQKDEAERSAKVAETKETPIERKEAAKESKKPVQETQQSSLPVIEGDAIKVAARLIKEGNLPVINNAANANRDGSAKLTRGSLEEILARHSDAMFTMPCHFRDVDAEYFGEEENTAYVEDCQVRYLRACLSSIDAIENHEKPDDYISSNQFLSDFLNAGKGIYFELQNTVYEVDAKAGFVSHAVFDNANYDTREKLDTEFKSPDEKTVRGEMAVVYAAAPDRRNLEGAPYDKHCTLDFLLRNPDDQETLQKMVEGGVDTQCKEALELKKAGKNPHIVFILPGCGAFGNPLQQTAKIFIDAIKKHQPELEKAGISFSIVERDPKICKVLRETWDPSLKQSKKYSKIAAILCVIAPSLYLKWMNYKVTKQLNQQMKEAAENLGKPEVKKEMANEDKDTRPRSEKTVDKDPSARPRR